MSRSCEKALAQIYLYIDDEMGGIRRLRLWWHLRSCPPCSEGVAFEMRLKQWVHDGCAEEVPPEIYERLRAFLRKSAVEGPVAE